jgi:hypothetical protein
MKQFILFIENNVISVRPQEVKILEENKEEMLQDIGICQGIWM